MNAGILLASVNQPVHLVKGDEVAGSSTAWVVLAIVCLVALIAIAWWGVALYSARTRRDEPEHAFKSVARALAVPAAMCKLIRKLAQAHGGATPAGLLLSDHGLTTAIAAYERNGVTKGDQKLLERLSRDFGL